MRPMVCCLNEALLMSTHDMLPLFGTSNEYQQHILKETNTYQATQLIWSYIGNPHSFSLINPWILSGVSTTNLWTSLFSMAWFWFLLLQCFIDVSVYNRNSVDLDQRP